ncbi:ABC transporter permease [Nocardioides yefusunii]|uniref:ABC transporter permease n=1 Tax=Nocardioides yefusunii TaxID=2500546 RepID=A0ABW1QX27_9ACTN|nr:ABC transporter permease [Nocardioides yefusunii]
MSTLSSDANAPRRGVIDVAATSKVPFLRLVSVEMRKMTDTRAGIWLLAILVAVVAVAVVAVAVTSRPDGAPFFGYVLSTTVPLSILLPVLGILLITGEWTQRTTLSTFTLESSRMRVMTAKIVTALLYAVLGLALAAGAAALFALAFGADQAFESANWPLLLNVAVLLTILMLQGVAFGTLILSSAGAIVAFFLVPVIFSIVLSFFSGLSEHVAWFDTQAAQASLMNDALPSATEWAQLGTTSLIWIVLPLVVGLVRIARMELK